MDSLAQMIEETKDARELKRALSVKMTLAGMATAEVRELLHVTPRYVRKWRGRYEREGVEALRVGYRGSESYLSAEQRQAIADWLGAQETVTVEEVRIISKRTLASSISPNSPITTSWTRAA